MILTAAIVTTGTAIVVDDGTVTGQCEVGVGSRNHSIGNRTIGCGLTTIGTQCTELNHVAPLGRTLRVANSADVHIVVLHWLQVIEGKRRGGVHHHGNALSLIDIKASRAVLHFPLGGKASFDPCEGSLGGGHATDGKAVGLEATGGGNHANRVVTHHTVRTSIAGIGTGIIVGGTDAHTVVSQRDTYRNTKDSIDNVGSCTGSQFKIDLFVIAEFKVIVPVNPHFGTIGVTCIESDVHLGRGTSEEVTNHIAMILVTGCCGSCIVIVHHKGVTKTNIGNTIVIVACGSRSAVAKGLRHGTNPSALVIGGTVAADKELPFAETEVGDGEGIGSSIDNGIVIVGGEEAVGNLPSGGSAVLCPRQRHTVATVRHIGKCGRFGAAWRRSNGQVVHPNIVSIVSVIVDGDILGIGRHHSFVGSPRTLTFSHPIHPGEVGDGITRGGIA